MDAQDNSAIDPIQMSIALLEGTFVGGRSQLFFTGGDGTSRLSGQIDVGGQATGAYDYGVEVRNWWSATESLAEHALLRVLVVNEANSPYGAGWSVQGLQRLNFGRADGAAVVTQGDGSIEFFAKGLCDATGCDFTSPTGDYTRLRYDAAANRYTRRYDDGALLIFAATGELLSEADRYGNTTTYVYANALLTEIHDPLGFAFVLSYSTGRLASITDPGGRQATFVYDASGNLIKVTDPDGATSFEAGYDSYHRLAWSSDRSGARTEIVYDDAGNVVTVEQPAIETTDAGTVRPIVGVRSALSATLPAAGRGATEYAADRVLPDSAYARLVMPRGNTIKVWPHRTGLPLRRVEREPSGKENVTTWVRNADGNPTSYVPPDGAALTLTWANGRLMSVTKGYSDRATTYAYEPTFGLLKTITVGDTVVQTNWYRADGALDSVKVDTSHFHYTFDGRGRQLTMIDPEGHESRQGYDPSGFQNLALVATVQNGVEKRISFGYDGYGRQTRLTDPTARVFTMEFDPMNRGTRETSPDTGEVRYGFNDAARTYTFTDALGNTYTDSLNALGWRVKATDPKGKSRIFGYDRAGNLTRRVDRRGLVTTFEYDSLDRLILQVADGKPTTFSYDVSGRQSVVANGESLDTLATGNSRQPANQVSIRGGGMYRHALNWTYDRADARRLIRLIVGDNTGTPSTPTWNYVKDSVSVSEDGAGRPNYIARVTNAVWTGTSITYNADGQPMSISLPTGTTTADRLQLGYTFTSSHVVDRFSLNKPTLDGEFGRAYRFDASTYRVSHVRRRLAASDDSTFRNFLYTPFGRLQMWADIRIHYELGDQICPTRTKSDCYNPKVKVTDTLQTGSFAYDRVGNRRDHAAIVATGNRVTSFDGYTLDYDDEGNLTRKAKGTWVQTLVWDALGQLTSVTTNGVVTSFGYDGLGRRVRKTAGGVTTYYLYDGAKVIAEVRPGPTILRMYTYYPGVDDPHSVTTGGRTYFYISDEPGHVTALVDANNVAVNKYEYGPFGETHSTQEQVPQPFRYAGRELDSETGLYYMRARYYDPTMGRFVSEDPLGLVNAVNVYVYVGDDPINLLDRLGLCATARWTRLGSGPWTYDGPGPDYGAGLSLATNPGGTEYSICACDGKTWLSAPYDLGALQGCGNSDFMLNCGQERDRCDRIVKYAIAYEKARAPAYCLAYSNAAGALFAAGRVKYERFFYQSGEGDYDAPNIYINRPWGWKLLQGDIGLVGALLVHEAAHSIHGGHDLIRGGSYTANDEFYSLERLCTVNAKPK